ncbi:MAG: UDP-N-acetylmuramoyl-L-alanyl-D-glutamate--2,6-diaminopimelate ligase [Ferruginibacter sp.]
MLQELLYKVPLTGVYGKTDIGIRSLHTDSRQVEAGSMFIAIRGTVSDGHSFIDQAIECGAVAILCETLPDKRQPAVTYVQVADSALALGIVCDHFYKSPSASMCVVGVTGTNGKTTTATVLYDLYTSLGYVCGLISTIRIRIGQQEIDSTHTTPDAIRLQQQLASMQEAGCTHVFMECSSHAIHQHRIAGIRFAVAVFTNITHDHLDYHQTFNEYVRVKKSWFDGLEKDVLAISNADDKRGKLMLQDSAAKKYYYGIHHISDFTGKLLDCDLSGLHMRVADTDVHFAMIGAFNAYNLLAVYAVAVLLGEDKQKVLEKLSVLKGAQGRFEPIVSKLKQVVGIVDYAHTPDALLNVLATIHNLRKKDTKVITVVGCGGNRDREKRPLMTQVACQYSDCVILTSDNPRFEKPEMILEDMQTGINITDRKKCLVIVDRKEAIRTAVRLVQPADILLLAGKGHETYQEIQGVKYPFDDKEILQSVFDEMEY